MDMRHCIIALLLTNELHLEEKGAEYWKIWQSRMV
jgi:hypothetical protein